MIYDYFQVTGAHDTVHDYADLFAVTLRIGDVQEFDALPRGGASVVMAVLPQVGGR